jgi:hypothetical protein
MASNQTPGYHPIALPDWKDRLQSLAAYIETLEADRPQTANPGFIAKDRATLITHYVLDLERSLEKANAAIRYYESLTHNYDRLVTVMEESRNQAYDLIGRLKDEIAIALKYRPRTDGVQNEEADAERGKPE